MNQLELPLERQDDFRLPIPRHRVRPQNTHSRGLRPLPPTPRKSCRRVVSGDASEAVLKSAFRTDGANRTSSKLLGRRETVALLSNCDIKRFQNCPVRMEGAQRTISEMSGRCKTVAQPFHAIGNRKKAFRPAETTPRGSKATHATHGISRRSPRTATYRNTYSFDRFSTHPGEAALSHLSGWEAQPPAPCIPF